MFRRTVVASALFATALAWWGVGCESPAPAPVAPPGVSVAQTFLYPYVFESQATLRGAQLLQTYLQEHPEGRDANMARWLVTRTSLDMLTLHQIHQALGEPEASQRLLEQLGALWSTAATPAALYAALQVPLEALLDCDSVLASEASAALLLLDAMRTDDLATRAINLVQVTATPTSVAFNASVSIAIEAWALFASKADGGFTAFFESLCQRYPYPCVEVVPTPHLAEDCGYVCAGGPADESPEARVRRCGHAFWGLPAAEDAVYLSRANHRVARALRHMALLQQRLDNAVDHPLRGLPAVDAFVDGYRDLLATLAVPLWPAPESPARHHLHLPKVSASNGELPYNRHVVVVGRQGIFVDMPHHFRLDQGRVIIPESSLNYRFPGRPVLPFVEPWRFAGNEILRGMLPALVPFLDDLERDGPRLSRRFDDRESSREEGQRALLRRTTLILDAEVPATLLLPLLRTLNHRHLRPFQVWVVDTGSDAWSGLDFDTAAGPLPLDKAHLWLRANGWCLGAYRVRWRCGTWSATDKEGPDALRRYLSESAEGSLYVGLAPESRVQDLTDLLAFLQGEGISTTLALDARR